MFGQHFGITEAIDAGGDVFLRDQNYVHIAVRRIGLGRLIFTSFPMSALEKSADAASRFWSFIIEDRPRTDWRTAALGKPEEQNQLVQNLAGAPAPRWSIAAGFAGAFLIVVAATHLLRRGAARPRAYAINLSVAAAMSIILLGAQLVRDRQSKLTGSRLVTLDLGPDGGGRQQELLSFLGSNEPNLELRAARPDVSIRPTIASLHDAATLDLHPVAAPRAGALGQAIARLWSADATIMPGRSLQAVAHFGPEGLSIQADNRLTEPLTMPMLLCGPRWFRLETLPDGQSTQPVPENSAASVVTDQARLRARIAMAAQSPDEPQAVARPGVPAFTLVGWVASAPPVVTTQPPLEVPPVTQVMVRVPVRIEPSPVGSQVRIDGSFTRMMNRSDATLPVVPGAEAWNAVTWPGEWTVCFAPPSAIGRLKVNRATVDVNAIAPEHTLVFRTVNGRSLASLHSPLGQHTFSFEPAAADLDQNGWVLIRLTVAANASRGSASIPPQWQLHWLRMSCDAQVVGPPFAPVFAKTR